MYEAQIALGVVTLDAWDPTWRDRVDPTALHMSSCVSCVVGQTFDVQGPSFAQGYVEPNGRYWHDALNELGAPPLQPNDDDDDDVQHERRRAWTVERGFDVGFDGSRYLDYQGLTEEWSAYLRGELTLPLPTSTEDTNEEATDGVHT